MITYETNHLVDKFLSDMDYQAPNPSGQAKLTQTGFCTGLKVLIGKSAVYALAMCFYSLVDKNRLIRLS